MASPYTISWRTKVKRHLQALASWISRALSRSMLTPPVVSVAPAKVLQPSPPLPKALKQHDQKTGRVDEMSKVPIKVTKPWSQADLALLKHDIQLNANFEDTALLLGRSEYDVRKKARELIVEAIARSSMSKT